MNRLATPLAMAAFALAALIGVLSRPLLPIDETRYLAVAWEMRVSGDWLVPHINGALYTQKPPMLFWLINLVWSVLGVTETGARLVGPAFGVAAIGATGLLGRRIWPDRPGLGGRAALILAGFGVYGLYAGLTMFDAMLTLATVLGVLALVETDRTPRAWFGFGAALALGAFAKGPVILIHLLPAALLLPLWSRTRVGPALRGIAIAIGTALAIVAVWLVPAIVMGGEEYRNAVLWSQHAGRVTDSFAHERPFWYFAALLPLLLWPWIWSPDVWRGLLRLDHKNFGLRMCLCWGASTFLLFSLISGKQTHYLLPALPAVALIIAYAVGSEPIRARFAGILPAAVGVALLALAIGLAPDPEIAALGQPGWVPALVGLIMIGLGASALRLRGMAVALLGLALPAIGALIFAFGSPGGIYDAHRIARLIASHDQAGVALLKQGYHGEFTFAARLANPILEIEELAEALAWLAATPDGILIARLDKDAYPEMPPTTEVNYRNRPYGIWISPPLPSDLEDPAS